MKTVTLLLCALLIALVFSWLSIPYTALGLSGLFQEFGWVGLELFGFLLVMVCGIAIVALLSVGLLGVGLVMLIGLVLAFLFNSVMIAIPLLMILALTWLVFEKAPQQ